MEREGKVLLQLKGMIKAFPSVLANDQIDFYIREGEIHALLGTLPYLLTIEALAGFVGRAAPPAYVGKPFIKETEQTIE